MPCMPEEGGQGSVPGTQWALNTTRCSPKPKHSARRKSRQGMDAPSPSQAEQWTREQVVCGWQEGHTACGPVTALSWASWCLWDALSWSPPCSQSLLSIIHLHLTFFKNYLKFYVLYIYCINNKLIFYCPIYCHTQQSSGIILGRLLGDAEVQIQFSCGQGKRPIRCTIIAPVPTHFALWPQERTLVYWTYRAALKKSLCTDLSPLKAEF